MTTKAELTSQYILEIVAPIFNKNGYAATSLSDVTSATGLTKGAIYGNFKNKEDLAIAAFKFTMNNIMEQTIDYVSKGNTPLEKLFLITDFYRNYYDYSKQFGGCPILNIGVDANNQNTLLLQEVRQFIEEIQDQIATVIEDGIEAGEISSEINVMKFIKRLDSMAQGSIFMAYTMDDDFYIRDAMDFIDEIINRDLKIA